MRRKIPIYRLVRQILTTRIEPYLGYCFFEYFLNRSTDPSDAKIKMIRVHCCTSDNDGGDVCALFGEMTLFESGVVLGIGEPLGSEGEEIEVGDAVAVGISSGVAVGI